MIYCPPPGTSGGGETGEGGEGLERDLGVGTASHGQQLVDESLQSPGDCITEETDTHGNHLQLQTLVQNRGPRPSSSSSSLPPLPSHQIHHFTHYTTQVFSAPCMRGLQRHRMGREIRQYWDTNSEKEARL